MTLLEARNLQVGYRIAGKGVFSRPVILPIVQTVGEQLPGAPHPKLLVMGAALMCSGAMGLPVSGFPNMNAVALEDPTGVNYVDTMDFLKVGVPGSVLTYGVIISLGYWLMLLVRY